VTDHGTRELWRQRCTLGLFAWLGRCNWWIQRLQLGLDGRDIGVEQVVEQAALAWVRIPRSSGHPFHEHLTTYSTVIWPPIPRVSDH
jgi:hypothetical protein